MLQAVAYVLVFVGSWVVLRRSLRLHGLRARPTAAAATLWLVVAASSVLGLLWPAWLAAGSRELPAVLEGQVWRLVTSMFLQDGGVSGTVFNLVTLAVTLLLVAPVVRPAALVLGFVVAGIACNLLVLALLRQGGAGNSMATMCLAVVPATVAAIDRSASWPSRVALGVVTLVTLALDVVNDQHGLAVTLALVVGVVVGLVRRSRLSPR